MLHLPNSLSSYSSLSAKWELTLELMGGIGISWYSNPILFQSWKVNHYSYVGKRRYGISSACLEIPKIFFHTQDHRKWWVVSLFLLSLVFRAGYVVQYYVDVDDDVVHQEVGAWFKLKRLWWWGLCRSQNATLGCLLVLSQWCNVYCIGEE